MIGRPKQPTLTLCTLNGEGHYDRQLLRGDQPLVCQALPQLILTAGTILAAATGI